LASSTSTLLPAAMSGTAKKSRKKKEKKKEPKKDPLQVVVRSLAENVYTGVIRDGDLGSQYLDCDKAKYEWSTGISYEGPFVATSIEGRGKFVWPDGSWYEGELHNGKRHGEGVYASADGTTRYVGQWFLGKRQGRGRLTYNKSGSSYYDGGWKDGKKDGEGKQVWPSGNCYEGQWEDGKMHGTGTMMWRAAGMSEQYTGCWQNNQPHGEGTHTWLAPEPGFPSPTSSPVGSPTKQQQRNNRYKGQWCTGKREGLGTFFYANGACYQGEWRDHMKQGHGRHTDDDGRVSEGFYERDRLTESGREGESPSGTPNGGGSFSAPTSPSKIGFFEDNTVSRCTDIVDLLVLAVPSDCSGFEPVTTSGYMEPQKVLKEVYNILLRNLGDLRELYARYRAQILRKGADPFTFKAYQSWVLARDAGLVTPGCPLARIGRAMASGPRHHREVAPEDMADVRPLTPRFMPDRQHSADSHSEMASPHGDQATDAGLLSAGRARLNSSRPTSPASVKSGSEDSGSVASSSPSPNNGGGNDHRQGTPDDASVSPTSGAELSPANVRSISGGGEEDKDVFGVAAPPLGRKFLRRFGDGLVNIHSPARPLLFRQFMEGLVRLSLVRFPYENGISSQMHRLFKEHLSAIFDPQHQPSSQDIFAFLADANFQRTLDEFQSTLWQLFCGAVKGGGGGDAAVGTAMAPPAAEPGGDPEGPPSSGGGGHRFGDYGGPVRQFHVQGRFDATVRVKDVLKLFERLGLLRPMPTTMFSKNDPYGTVFRATEEEDAASSVDEGSGGSGFVEADIIDEDKPMQPLSKVLKPQDTTSSFGVSRYGQGFMPHASLLSHNSEESSVFGQSKAAQSGAFKGKEQGDIENLRKDGADLDVAVTQEDLAKCDFSITALKLMRSLAEVLSSHCMESICWQLDPAVSSSERTSFLEYAETELVYSEFLRLLVQVADIGTSKSALAVKVPLQRRFEGFVRHVLVPALSTPYVAPEPEAHRSQLDESAEADEDAEEGDDGEEISAGAEEGSGAMVEEAEEKEEVPKLKLWQGFEDGCPKAAFAQAPRSWPADYEQEKW